MQRLFLIIIINLFIFCPYLVHAQERMQLSLEDAILLAIRSNPNVESRELAHVLNRYNTLVQQWQFLPHYNLVGAANFTGSGRSNNQYMHGSSKYELSPSVSLLSPYGTKFTLTSNNTRGRNYNPGVSLQIIQPLMRGFGRPIVEAALLTAYDSEYVSRLNVEGTLRTTISDIINAYLDVISAEHALAINEQALKRAQESVKQTKLFIKAGHKAGNEIVTVEANVASAQSQLEDDRNTLSQARYALLTAIGIDPNTPVKLLALDPADLIKKYHLPNLEQTKAMALSNDIEYQSAQITLNGSTLRSVITAEDNAKPVVNLTANLGTGNGSGGGYNAGVNSLVNGTNFNNGLILSVDIPIDNMVQKQSILSAKIALKQAQLALMQSKWSKETGAINGWNRVGSAERSLKYALDAEKLQAQTYKISYQKYLHGLIDSLELQSAQVRLIEAQQSSLRAKINYLKSLVSIDLLTGHTLKTWNIKVRF